MKLIDGYWLRVMSEHVYGKLRWGMRMLCVVSCTGLITSRGRGMPQRHAQSVVIMNCQKLKSTLDEAGFSIFESINDLGFFAWKTDGPTCAKSLASVQDASQILDCIDLEEKPDVLAPIEELNAHLPKRFLESSRLPSQAYTTVYPHENFDIAALHVAKNHKGMDLDTVDFMFGGSVLDIMSRQSIPDPDSKYLAMQVPTTNIILVKKYKQYDQDFSVPGFQLQRFVCGGNFSDHHRTHVHMEHLQSMKIDGHNVLVSAENDAVKYCVDGFHPAEIKGSRTKFFGTRVMFQMISGGCLTLCHGVKAGAKELACVDHISLSTVCDRAFKSSKYAKVKILESNLRRCLKRLQTLSSLNDHGDVFEISFGRRGVYFTKSDVHTMDTLFPKTEIVEEILEMA